MSDVPKKKVMISLTGVKKTYKEQTGRGGRKREPDDEESYVVKGVDLTVREGELLVLLGGSGCGKTTTLKMINRLEEPTEGTIEVNGETVISIQAGTLKGGWKAAEIPAKRRKIGYVIQQSGLFPHMTVAQNIAIVPRLLGEKEWPDPRIKQRVDELLNLVCLPATDEFRDTLACKLSGGQAQRVGFARAVAAKPPVMLLDEPFGALDPLIREEVRQAFNAIRVAEGLTAVMVTHDMAEALLMADWIAVMEKGRVVQCAPPREILNHPKTDYVRKFIRDPLYQNEKINAIHDPTSVGGVA